MAETSTTRCACGIWGSGTTGWDGRRRRRVEAWMDRGENASPLPTARSESALDLLGANAGGRGDDLPGYAVLAELSGVIESLSAHAFGHTLGQAFCFTEFDAFLAEPVHDFGHVSLLETLLDVSLFVQFQSTLHHPDRKVLAEARQIAEITEREGHFHDLVHPVEGTGHVWREGQGNAVGCLAKLVQPQRGHLHDPRPEAEVRLPHRAAIDRVEQLAGSIVIHQSDGKDFIVRETAAQVQVVAGCAQQVEPVSV